MKHVRLVPALLSAVMLAACTTTPAPNDSASRALNEMKAVPRPIPPKPDPRDLKIADLERQKADLEAELAKLRSSAADLDQAKARINELENQLSQRDRVAGLRAPSATRTGWQANCRTQTSSCRPGTKNWRA